MSEPSATLGKIAVWSHQADPFAQAPVHIVQVGEGIGGAADGLGAGLDAAAIRVGVGLRDAVAGRDGHEPEASVVVGDVGGRGRTAGVGFRPDPIQVIVFHLRQCATGVGLLQ